MRSWERVSYARLAVPCGIAAISLLAIAGRDHAIHNVGGGMGIGMGMAQALPGELLVMPTSCIAMMRPSCSIQLAGGLLHVTNISFPDGLGGNGTAWASGVVKGKVVYGEVGLHGDAETEGNWTEGGGKEFGADDEDVRLYNRTRSGHGLDPIDAQYQTAIRQVVGNMKSRTTAMASDAKKIAKAVTKVLTSSAVSSTIADMAWNLAEKKYKDDNSMMTPVEIEQAATAGIAAATGKAVASPGGEKMHGEWESTQEAPHLSDASAASTSPGEVSDFAKETIENNPAAGASGPRAGTFGGVVCAGCLVCPGCCQNGWVPGCLAFNRSTADGGPAAVGGADDDPKQWGGETVGEQIGKASLFDPQQIKPEFKRIDAQWKASLRRIQNNVAEQQRQQQLARELEREKVQQKRAAAQKAKAERERRRSLDQAEFVPLQTITDDTNDRGELGDPMAAFKGFEKDTNGYLVDGSARWSNTDYQGTP